MASKQQDDLFPTTALVPSTHQSSGNLALSQRSKALVKAENKIMGEAHKQQLIIGEKKRITEQAQRALGELHYSDEQQFTETADRIWDLRTPNSREPELQRFIDHHCAQTIQSAGNYIRAATIAGSERILDEVNRSIYVETKEARRLLAVLRGETE